MANAIVNNIINAVQPLSVKLNELFKKHPMDGLMVKANEQMKESLFTHHENEPSLLSKATAIKNNLTNTVKSAFETSTNPTPESLNNSTTTVTPLVIEKITPYSDDVIFVGKPITMTFSEKARRDWLFTWYSNQYQEGVYPSMSVPHGTSNNLNDGSTTIQVTNIDSTIAIPILNSEKNDTLIINQEPMTSK